MSTPRSIYRAMLGIVLASILSAPSAVVLAEADLQIRVAEIIAFGVFDARYEQRHAAGFRTRAPAADTVSNINFVEFTNEIPGELGTLFGYQYVINSFPRGASMEIEQVIVFPGDGLHQPGGRVYTESRERQTIRIGEPAFYGYGFDEPWEIVPGEWSFEVWYNGARVIRKTFTVLAPEVDATEEVAGQ